MKVPHWCNYIMVVHNGEPGFECPVGSLEMGCPVEQCPGADE